MFTFLRQVASMIDRIATLIENVIHEWLMLLRDYFEILFIAALYLGVAWILARQGLNTALEHWLTGGVLIGAIATLINRFAQSRYRGNGNGASEIETETETRMHRITKTDTRPVVIDVKTDPPKDTQNG